MSAILKEDPPAPPDLGLKSPPALDGIVRHCLEKDRDHRFQSVRDVVFNLSEQLSQAVLSGAQDAAPPGRKTAPRPPGLALAYLGRKTEAIREGERAAGLLPVTSDASTGP